MIFFVTIVNNATFDTITVSHFWATIVIRVDTGVVLVNVALLVCEVVKIKVLFSWKTVLVNIRESKILNHLIFDIIWLAIYRANLTIPDLIICVYLLQTYYTLFQPLLFCFSNNNHIQIRPMKRVNHHIPISYDNLPHLITNITLDTKIFIQRLLDSLQIYMLFIILYLLAIV